MQDLKEVSGWLEVCAIVHVAMARFPDWGNSLPLSKQS